MLAVLVGLGLACDAEDASGSGSGVGNARQCIDESRDGQIARRDGHLLVARQTLERCTQACPEIVRADCARELAEVNAAIPSVILAAVDDAGHEIVDVSARFDDEAIAAALDGREHDLDPGPHRVELVRSGNQHTTLRFLAMTGERARRLVATFPAPDVVRPVEHVEPPEPPHNNLLAPVALGVLGLSAFGLGAYFQLSGSADVRDVRDHCGMSCSASEVESLDRVRDQKAWGARVSVGVGVLAITGAILLLVLPPARRAGLRGGALGALDW